MKTKNKKMKIMMIFMIFLNVSVAICSVPTVKQDNASLANKKKDEEDIDIKKNEVSNELKDILLFRRTIEGPSLEKELENWRIRNSLTKLEVGEMFGKIIDEYSVELNKKNNINDGLEEKQTLFDGAISGLSYYPLEESRTKEKLQSIINGEYRFSATPALWSYFSLYGSSLLGDPFINDFMNKTKPNSHKGLIIRQIISAYKKTDNQTQKDLTIQTFKKWIVLDCNTYIIYDLDLFLMEYDLDYKNSTERKFLLQKLINFLDENNSSKNSPGYKYLTEEIKKLTASELSRDKLDTATVDSNIENKK